MPMIRMMEMLFTLCSHRMLTNTSKKIAHAAAGW